MTYQAFAGDILLYSHREHTILLSKKRLNKGIKRMNSLPLSPVVFQVLRNTVALNSYLGPFALC